MLKYGYANFFNPLWNMSEVISRGDDLHPSVKVTDRSFSSSAFPETSLQHHKFSPENLWWRIRAQIAKNVDSSEINRRADIMYKSILESKFHGNETSMAHHYWVDPYAENLGHFTHRLKDAVRKDAKAAIVDDIFTREISIKYKGDIAKMAENYNVRSKYTSWNLDVNTTELRKSLSTERYQQFRKAMDKELADKFGWDIKRMLKAEKFVVYPWNQSLLEEVTLKDLYFREKAGVWLLEWFKAMRTWEEISALKSQVQAAREARIASQTAQNAVKVAKKLF